MKSFCELSGFAQDTGSDGASSQARVSLTQNPGAHRSGLLQLNIVLPGCKVGLWVVFPFVSRVSPSLSTCHEFLSDRLSHFPFLSVCLSWSLQTQKSTLVAYSPVSRSGGFPLFLAFFVPLFPGSGLALCYRRDLLDAKNY